MRQFVAGQLIKTDAKLRRGLQGLVMSRSRGESNRLSEVLRGKSDIKHIEEHRECGEVLRRIEFECGDSIRDEIERLCQEEEGAKLEWNHRQRRRRVVVFASNEAHALIEVLGNASQYEVPLVISNHQSLRPIADDFKTRFEYLPRYGLEQENKDAIEDTEIALLEEVQADVLVLARYMQILSPRFCSLYEQRIINIHHSLLPAFKGGRAHQKAYDRGVKLIGATAHYVTEDLDDGPIIAQAALPCSHRDSVADLRKLGRKAECLALRTALSAHLDSRVFLTANGLRTVVFDGL